MTQPKKSKRSNQHQHINHDTIIKDDNLSHATPCDLSCLNGGYCTFIQYFDYPIPGQSGYYQGCQCPPDYHGGQCELVVEECSPPNYTCSNGAPCIEQSGGYVCDCSYADKMSNVAGEMCRDSKMTSCDTRDVNVKSFCMNGGECLSAIDGIEFKKQILDAPSTHEGCQCLTEFEGPHCEHLKNQPMSTLILSYNMRVDNIASSKKAKIGTSVTVTLCVLIIGMAMFVRRKNRQRNFLQGSEERFHSLYMDNLARDLGNLSKRANESDDEGSLEEVEFDRQDTKSSLFGIENGVEAEYL